MGCGGPANALISVEELLETAPQPLPAHILGYFKGIVTGKCRTFAEDRHPEWGPTMIASHIMPSNVKRKCFGEGRS